MTTITVECAALSLIAAATHLNDLDSAVKRGEPIDPALIAEARSTVERYRRIVLAMDREQQRERAAGIIAERRAEWARGEEAA